jgi:tetratricopeptide (TPR) repeat protein
VALLDLRLGDVLLEHRAYLPDAGLCALAGAGAVYLSRRLGSNGRAAVLALLVALSILLVGLTSSRNAVWRSEVSLWTDVVEKAPDKARGYNNLAMAYSGMGKTDEALRNFDIAVLKEPDFPLAHYNMGSVLGRLGRLDEAEEHLLEAVRLRPKYGHAHNNLGNVYLLKGDLEKAQEQFKLAVYYRPDNYEAHRNLALVYQRMGKVDMAREQMRIAESLRSKAGAP